MFANRNHASFQRIPPLRTAITAFAIFLFTFSQTERLGFRL